MTTCARSGAERQANADLLGTLPDDERQQPVQPDDRETEPEQARAAEQRGAGARREQPNVRCSRIVRTSVTARSASSCCTRSRSDRATVRRRPRCAARASSTAGSPAGAGDTSGAAPLHPAGDTCRRRRRRPLPGESHRHRARSAGRSGTAPARTCRECLVHNGDPRRVDAIVLEKSRPSDQRRPHRAEVVRANLVEEHHRPLFIRHRRRALDVHPAVTEIPGPSGACAVALAARLQEAEFNSLRSRAWNWRPSSSVWRAGARSIAASSRLSRSKPSSIRCAF